jgi:hypothetical protein
VDWVLIQLYKLENGNLVFADAQSAVLSKSGVLYEPTFSMLQGLYFPELPAGDYYINVIHRNHLAIGTAETVYLSSAYEATTFNADFTIRDSNSPDFLTLLAPGSVKDMGSSSRCLRAGDLNGDYQINADDGARLRTSIAATVLNPSVGTITLGYQTPDLNLNGQAVYGSTVGQSVDLDFILDNNGTLGQINEQ